MYREEKEEILSSPAIEASFMLVGGHVTAKYLYHSQSLILRQK